MMQAMSLQELLDLPVAVDLGTAGRAHGFGRTKAHELARNGRFPCRVRKVGGTYRVTRADLLASLGVEDVVLNRSVPHMKDERGSEMVYPARGASPE